MSLTSPNGPIEPILITRRPRVEHAPRRKTFRRRFLLSALILVVLLAVATPIGYVYARHWVRTAVLASLPQLDGTVAIPELSAPVNVQRDTHGVPHIRATNLDDLLIAQGFITAQDRLFQMDLLRRHAAGELAEILGPSVLGHDRLQRILQIRATADRAVASLPPAQLHMLEQYAEGVNASIAAQSAHLPIEFRILRYQPAPWTPRDSLLVSLAMLQDLTSTFPTKLARESLLSRLPAADRAQLEQDLYPVGSWRDHPPAAQIPDLTIEGPPIEDVPLDESQSSLHPPTLPSHSEPWSLSPEPSLFPGSNNWVVSGTHTASGKPLLSNDMHLALTLPGIWYEADLEVQPDGFHAAGVSIPGLPLIIGGHNDHIAWGFTNLGADVQDVYLETTRGTGNSQEFLAVDGTWQPIVRLSEPIKLKGGKTLAFEVLATRHGAALTPILNPVLTQDVTDPHKQSRTLALRWSIYDPGVVQFPVLAVDSAHDWPSFLAAFSNYGWPAQNVVYADDRGHIGFHVIGQIPMRGPAQSASSASAFLPPDVSSAGSPPIAPNPVPLNSLTSQPTPALPVPQLSGPIIPVPFTPARSHEWTGFIPFDQLPQLFDPPAGLIATANSRTAPDDYPYPITLDWGAPYRNERIWHLLAHSKSLTPASMLAIQTDIDSDFDCVLAQRLAYALDHSLAGHNLTRTAAQAKQLHQAADLLRSFNGRMAVGSPAAAVLAVTHVTLWPMLLEAKLPGSSPEQRNELYIWGERDYALEQILMHAPARWLPAKYTDWNDFLAAAVQRALADTKAPADLIHWTYGGIHPVDIESPIFSQSALLRTLLGRPTGTGRLPQSGDRTTIKQVGPDFGPSERFTADLANLDQSTLNIVLGQSGNPASPWFLDQFQAWYSGTTFPMQLPVTHTLTLGPRAQ